VLLAPDPAAWPKLLQRDTPYARATRQAIGLATDKPVVLSGHQGTVWHPGILAKRFALQSYSHAHNADCAWIVVDQDTPDPWKLEYPAREGHLLAREVVIAKQRADDATPLCVRNAVRPSPGAFEPAVDSMHSRWQELIEQLESHADAPNAAAQINRATNALLDDGVRTIMASTLHTTPVMERMVQRMRTEPELCARAYNDAVTQHGGARVLIQRGSDWELPLWQLGPLRRPVFASTLESIDPTTLAPRALAMTAMLRLDACDLFIHGTGGGATGTDQGYDRATEAWIAHWLGEDLAPSVVVSADLRLPLLEGMDATPLSDEDLMHAVHRAHTARHNPSLVGDSQKAREKAELVAQIAASSDPRERGRLYRQMHDQLEEYRAAHANDLAMLGDEADAVRTRLADWQIAKRRDWPWVLYEPEAIAALRSACSEIWA
jgi:hypothetical protein